MEDIFEGLNSRKKRKSTAHILKEEQVKNVYGVLIRVSTDMQVEDGDSIPMQQDRANEIINNNDGILYKFYIEEGISASKNRIKDRPQLQELLADVEAGIVNKIIAYKRDRLARNTKDYLTILEVCAKAKCDIIFSASGETQMMNDGVTGKVLETFLASIAEMESYNTSIRVRDVMSNKASKGEYTGFTLPYGYCKDEENKIIIEEGTESVIQEIEDLYLGGIGLLSIAKWLNGQKIMNLGVRPDGAVGKKALHKNRVEHWTKAAIESILFNPYYAGIIEYSTEGNKSYQIDDDKFIRAKGQHPAFRTLERQKEIYRARDRRTLQAPRLYNTTFLLTGLLYCAECGCKYVSRNTTKNGKRYSYYVCGSKHNDSKTVNKQPCKNKLYKKEILEEFIESSIEKYLSNVTFTGLEQDIVNEFSKKQDDISVKLKEIEESLISLNSDEQKILRLLMDLDPDKPTYHIFKERYENELTVIFEKTNDAKKLKLELTNQKEDKQDDEFITKKVLEKMQNFNKVYRNSPVHLRKASLDEIIDRIELFAT
jgi:DNA invertase Pin-like site-specific DNA recombinase